MFDDFDMNITCEEYYECMAGFEEWFEELDIADILADEEEDA